MKYLVAGVYLPDSEFHKKTNVLIEDGVIVSLSANMDDHMDARVISLDDCCLFPGFTDVHVHFREPGFSYKETILTGSRSGARGGYTTVCTMPNLNPVPDSAEHLEEQWSIIRKDACIQVLPYGSITVEEKGAQLADLDGMASGVVAFSDDGHGVQNDGMMKQAMARARDLNKLIVAHCEDNTLLHGGYIHDGKYAREHGHRGICSESEWKQIERDIELVRQTGCGYHVCHISTKESVELIRNAKEEGLNISCETAPHYLVLTEDDLQEDGRFKMNPPIRSAEDRQALRDGLKDGTIEMIATDHAPHSEEEKSRGLEKSAMGVVGLETAFPVLYTELVRTGLFQLEEILRPLIVNPNKRFGIEKSFAVGQPADFTVYDLNQEYVVDPAEFQTKGRSTPFAGRKVYGRCKLTFAAGNLVWEDQK